MMIGLLMAAALAAGAPGGIDLPAMPSAPAPVVRPITGDPDTVDTRLSISTVDETPATTPPDLEKYRAVEMPDAIAACIKNCLVFSATQAPKYPAKGAPVPKTKVERLIAIYDANPELFCITAEIAFSQSYFLDDDSDYVTLTGGDHKRECKGGQPVDEHKP